VPIKIFLSNGKDVAGELRRLHYLEMDTDGRIILKEILEKQDVN
jgi:hypothetical protein